MRKHLTIVLTTVAVAMPNVNALAAVAAPTSSAKKIVVARKTFTGGIAQADQWGNLQVTIVVKKTTTTAGTKKTVKRHIESIKVPVFPDHTGRSQFISQHALPTLIQEALTAQSTHIYIVSGATYTSDAFGQSLQAAIAKEKAW
ncbi:MAG TPA: FMN-binding protein [Gaiellales bacterium]|nr:FMN-binding protein [Gaiellales bacterium]